jgi:hypothetical protein
MSPWPRTEVVPTVDFTGHCSLHHHSGKVSVLHSIPLPQVLQHTYTNVMGIAHYGPVRPTTITNSNTYSLILICVISNIGRMLQRTVVGVEHWSLPSGHDGCWLATGEVRRWRRGEGSRRAAGEVRRWRRGEGSRRAAGEVCRWRRGEGSRRATGEVRRWRHGEGSRQAKAVGEVAAGGWRLRVRFSANCAAGCDCAAVCIALRDCVSAYWRGILRCGLRSAEC